MPSCHTGREPNATECREQHLCFVSANAAKDYKSLFQSCLNSDPHTEIVVLALQDNRGSSRDALPPKFADLDSLPSDKRFKLRDQMTLVTSEQGHALGEGNFCYHKYMSATGLAAASAGTFGFLGLLGGPKGALLGSILGGAGGYVVGAFGQHKLKIGCGGVVVAIYSFSKHDVSFDIDDASSHKVFTSEVSATTLKGTIALRIGVNGRHLIVASTHAKEGVRFKHRNNDAKNQRELAAMTKAEKKRTMDFRHGLEVIQSLRVGEAVIGKIWGGDFNARSLHAIGFRAQIGKPDFGEGPAREALQRLMTGGGILGMKPDETDHPTVHTTFTEELHGSDFVPISFPMNDPCPTYYKAHSHGEDQFVCESEIHGPQYYNFEKPPSWADRIFTHAPYWLKPSSLQRVPAKEDHDAVYATFRVRSPECDYFT